MGTSVRVLDAAERRRRIGVRHRLAPGALASGILEAAESLIALHATDPATVFLAARARTRDPDLAAMQRALYDDRTVLRMLAMRRTVFVVSRARCPSCGRRAPTRSRPSSAGGSSGCSSRRGIAEDGAAWVREVEDATVAALAARGEAGALAAELAGDVPRLREPVPVGSRPLGGPPAGVLLRRSSCSRPPGASCAAAPAEGGRARSTATRPRRAGSARRCRRRSPRPRAPSSRAAGSRAFGPAPAADLRWWAGWSVARAEARAGRGRAGRGRARRGNRPRRCPRTPRRRRRREPWAALLPALDPTVMGWAERGWYLGEHAPALFDRSGNAGPTVWWDGRVVGGWGQRPDGEVVVRLLEDVGREATAAVEAETARLQQWLRRLPRHAALPHAAGARARRVRRPGSGRGARRRGRPPQAPDHPLDPAQAGPQAQPQRGGDVGRRRAVHEHGQDGEVVGVDAGARPRPAPRA